MSGQPADARRPAYCGLRAGLDRCARRLAQALFGAGVRRQPGRHDVCAFVLLFGLQLAPHRLHHRGRQAHRAGETRAKGIGLALGVALVA